MVNEWENQRTKALPNVFELEIAPEMAATLRQVFWEAIADQWSYRRLEDSLASLPWFERLSEDQKEGSQ